MFLDSWIDERLAVAIPAALKTLFPPNGSIEPLLEKLLGAETDKVFSGLKTLTDNVFGKLDAQSVAILGTIATDLEKAGEAVVDDAAKGATQVVQTVTDAGTGLLDQLRGLIPGL